MGFPGGAAGFDIPECEKPPRRRRVFGTLANPTATSKVRLWARCEQAKPGCISPHHPNRDHLQLKSCLKPSIYIFTKTMECATPLPPLHPQAKLEKIREP